MFHLSHHRLVRFCWLGLVVVGVCLCFFAFLLTTDQPARSSYQPMTIIAYLHDCHCRYDERSSVQKKKLFDYQHEATTLLPNSDFLSLPDHVAQYGPVRAQTLGLYIPDSIRAWLLSRAPRIYDRKDLDLPGNCQLALPSILKRYFCGILLQRLRPSLLPLLAQYMPALSQDR